MKFAACILILISVSYAFEDQCRGANLRPIYDKCLQANGGDRVVIDDVLQLKKAEDENGKCFRDCIMRECNYYGGDGKFNHDVPTRLSWLLHGGDESHLKPIEEAASKCVESQTYSDSKCNDAEIFVRCLVKQSPVKLIVSNIYD